MEKGSGLVRFLNKIIPFRLIQWNMLGPNDVAVVSAWGKYKPHVRRGMVGTWRWEKATTFFAGQRMLTVGFYGDAGRFTNVYLSWLLKSFPPTETAPKDVEMGRWQCITREPIEAAVRYLEKELVVGIRKQLQLLKDKQPSQFKFQLIRADQDEKFYDELLKEPLLMKPLNYDADLNEIPSWLRNYFDYLIKQNTMIDVMAHIPAKVWKRVLSEVDELLLKWEEENLLSLQERMEKVFKKKEKEYDDAEQRDPKLKYNEAFQTERQDELRKLREKLKDQRRSEEDMIKGRKEEFELHNQALKEIDTMIIYHKIKFVEDVYNVFGGESFFSASSSSSPRIFIPNFSRVFGPFFTSEKIQMNMTASVFFTIVEPFKLIRNVGFERAMLVLVSKLASSLRSTISRLTLSEIFEERQKLMEMLRRELDDVAENWGVEIKSVAIEEIFLEDPAFQRILDDRREMELYGEKRIEQKRTEGSQILIQGRQQAERVVMESQGEKERELNRIHQAIERARVELDTRKIEAETLLKEKQYEAERALISVQAEVAEIALKSQALTPNILKRELIRNLPDIIEKMTNSMQTAILSPQQYLQLITGQMIYDAIEGGLSKMQAEVQDGKGAVEGQSKEVLTNIAGIPGIQNFDPSKSSIIANINTLLESIQGNLDPDAKSNEDAKKKNKN